MAILDALRELLFRLTPYLPGIVGVLIFLALVLIGILIFTARRAKKQAKGDDDGETHQGLDDDPDFEPFSAEPDDLPLLPMRQSFRHALKVLRSHVAGRDWRYAIPWYLLLGPEQSGKSTLASHTGLDLPVGHPADDHEDLRPACKWWFFDRGVLLDAAGSMIRQRDGRGSNAKAWRKFLGYLDRYRPRRPADGIVLTIPIEDFLDDTGAVRPPDDIMHRADAVYKKLWQAQARLGLAFPVYVVVTKLDRLPGFQSLVAELPDHALADMLGWASPYSFESEFRDTWVDEIAQTVGASIQAAEMEIFATTGNAQAAEEIYSLPNAFNGLREPMRIYLRQLFKPSVYHESFSLRGVWFTGDSGLEDASADRPVPILPGVYGGPRMRQAFPVFLRDLFETKIFPERNLARPVKRALLARNKVAIGAQATSVAVALLGALTLWLEHGAMHADVQTVEPFIKEVSDDVESIRAAEKSNALSSSASFNRERALSLLEGMAALKTGSFFSLAIPSSWVADVDDRVVRVTTDAFSLFILQSMGAALDERGTAIGAGRLPPEGPSPFAQDGLASATIQTAVGGSAMTQEAATRGPEYDLLRRFTRSVRDFESAILSYNQLQESQSLEDVRRLVVYLFDVALPESFLENSDFYEEALSGSNYRSIPLEAYRRDVNGRFDAYMNATVTALYAENPLVSALRQLGTSLDAAANSRSASLGDLAALRDRIAAVRSMLGDPAFAWMDDPAFDPSIAYAPLIDRIGGSRLLGPEKAEAFDAANRSGLSQLQNELPKLRALAIGPLLARDGDRTVLRLAAPVEDLAAVLDLLADQPFMRNGRFAPLPAAPPAGSAVEWDVAALDEAVDLVNGYQNFMTDELGRIPRSMHPFVRTAAGNALERSVNDRVAAAMSTARARGTGAIQSEDALRRAVAGFSEAGSVIDDILAAFDTLGLEDSYLDLLDLSVAVSFALIEEADSLFSAGSLYVPRGGDFDFWDGDPGLALDAFRARDPFELRDVLAQQRGRIGIIANGYVKPVANFLDALEVRLSDRETALLSKWRRIVDELAKFELQQADNTVAELERFITGPMMDVSFANCAETLDDAVSEQRSADFFLERISRLSRGIRDRCRDLAGVEAQSAYNAIGDAFDDHLAGRYPFTLTPYEADMREVSPRDLRAFFARYDREVEAARIALEQASDLGFERDRALEFIAQMDRVRAFFTPWLASSTGEDSPVFDLTVSFRVNRERELGGDQVISWELAAGGDTVTLRGENKMLRWGLGETIEVRLRWAENSNMVPAAAVDQPSVRVDGRTVALVYENIWSLVDLIRRHRAGSDDFTEFVDPRPHTLRLDIPTRPVGGGTIEPARLFLRVELSAQQDGQPVPLVMTPFPYEAPQLTP